MKTLIDKTGNIFTFRQRSSGQPAAKNSKSFRTSVEARTFLQQFPSVQLSQLGALFSDENQTPLTDPVSIQAQVIKNLCKGSLVVTSPPRPIPNNTVKTPAGTTQKTGPVEYIDPVPASEPPPANPSPTDAEATETKEQPNVTKEAETPCESDPVSMTTGEELLSLDDFMLPGPVPLVWRRTYRSSHSRNIGLGAGWAHTGCEHLLLHDTRVEYLDAEGRSIPFARPRIKQRSQQLSEGLSLDWDNTDQFCLHQTGQPDKIFTRISGNHYRLSQLRHKAYHPPDRDIAPRQRDTGERGYALNFHYNARGQLTRILSNRGRGLLFERDSQGHIRAIYPLDTDGQPLTPALAEYDYADSDLVAHRNADGHGECYAYQNHVITRRTLATGFSFHFDWDQHTPEGRCQRQWGDHDIYHYTFDWDPDNHTSYATDSLGHTARYHYDTHGRVLEEIDRLGEHTQHAYNACGKRITTTDPLGHQTHYHYDEQQRSTGYTDALGHYTGGHYFRGEMTSFSDAAGHTWQRHFGRDGLLSEVTDPQKNTTTYTHNRDGLLTCITDPTGRSTRYGWNTLGELIRETDPTGNHRHYRYDTRGRMIAVTAQAVGQPLKKAQQQATTRYIYTASGQMRRVTTPEGEHRDFQYNEAGHLTRYTDGQGRITEYQYAKGLSQPDQRIDPAGHILHYEYDRERNLTALINENGDRHTFTYDANERLIQEQGFDGRIQRYEYNPAGHLIRHQDGDHIQTDFDRDALGRLHSKLSRHLIDPDQKPEQSLYRYDPLGRLIETDNEHQHLAFDYDPRGNITREHQHDLNGEKQRIGDPQDIHHRYNPLGQRIATQRPDGRQIRYDYHESLGFQSLHFDGQLITQVQRDSLGREITREQGELHTRTDYDPQGRLQQQRTQHQARQHPLIQRDYGYDSFGNINRIKDGSEETRYLYDTLNRLKRTEGSHPEFFDFDPAGNILSISESPHHTPGLSKGNRLLIQGDKHFEYDERGNLIKETRGKNGKLEKRFQYNLQNQLVRVETNTRHETVTYKYDPLGRRIEKHDAFGSTRYQWTDNQLSQETRKGIKKTYLYEPASFRPVALVQDDQVYHYHLDHLGTPRELTDEQGKIVWRVKYKTYGNVALKEIEDIENNLRFQGQYFDEETGLHYNRHRYYNPDTGQFINQDPIGLLGGVNNYQYAPNPTGWIDPFGLACKEEIEKLMKSTNPVDRQKAIDEAIILYKIDTVGIKSITYDPTLTHNGVASFDGTVKIGKAAFAASATAGWLGSTIAHEGEIHIIQQANKKLWWGDEQGTALQEVQAYDHEINKAKRFGLTETEVADLKWERKGYYSDLNAENKARADKGDFATYTK
ncbi:MAG: DUF6531 domain-containing protein [Gammaproteobacteria bacterium]|nr:DUF6531 domain-containing protein [Gammaproteobacteria bacterium]